jgi:hypothetical protein
MVGQWGGEEEEERDARQGQRRSNGQRKSKMHIMGKMEETQKLRARNFPNSSQKDRKAWRNHIKRPAWRKPK